jgi:hypothetical protein
MTGFIDNFTDGAEAVQLGDVFSGKLNFTAETAHAKGVINLKLAPGPVYYGERSPVLVDEAYVTAWFGKLDITGGLRKLTWGKADSMGPLDVVNPLDYSDLSDLSDLMNLKIARPLPRIVPFRAVFQAGRGFCAELRACPFRRKRTLGAAAVRAPEPASSGKRDTPRHHNP